MPISLVLNGHPTTLDVDPRTPLLWALREAAGLTGPKYGCDTAQCGACTVHLDGQASLSCALPVADAANRNVTTIEGVTGPAVEAVRTSWRALQVVECGYCQPGQMMSAIALLAQSPQPGDAEIDRAMNGNLCRCGIYDRIRNAVRQAALELEG